MYWFGICHHKEDSISVQNRRGFPLFLFSTQYPFLITPQFNDSPPPLSVHFLRRLANQMFLVLNPNGHSLARNERGLVSPPREFQPF